MKYFTVKASFRGVVIFRGTFRAETKREAIEIARDYHIRGKYDSIIAMETTA